MKDIVVIAVFVLSFAVLATVHVAVAGKLVFSSPPRWRGLAALVVPPLAPIWAYREGWRRSVALWLGAAIACSLDVASRCGTARLRREFGSPSMERPRRWPMGSRRLVSVKPGRLVERRGAGEGALHGLAAKAPRAPH